jgi:hypothetical protein
MRDFSWFRRWIFVVSAEIFAILITVLPASGQEIPVTGKPVAEPRAVANYFYKFPPAVQKVLSDSMVGIEVTWQTSKRGLLDPKTKMATGFMVEDSIVLTALHTFSDIPEIWEANSTKIRICDGDNFFNAEILSVNAAYDLAAVVVGKNENNAKFKKRTVVFASPQDKKNFPDNFYSFALSSLGKNLYFPIKLGQYVMETTLVDDDILPAMVGMVLGNAESGFSGAPLIGPDGTVFGVLSMASPAYTYVTPIEQVLNFLKETIRLRRENNFSKPK